MHEAHGTLPLDLVLAEAIHLADHGFPASPLLAVMATELVDVAGVDQGVAAARSGRSVRRPRTADALRAVAAAGRAGFYQGEFGTGLLELGGGLYDVDDLARPQARWVDPVGADVFGHRVWTVPPPSQGYLALAGAAVAERLGSLSDPERLVAAAVAAGRDRPDVLHDGADPRDLLHPDRLDAQAAAARARSGGPSAPAADGDTTYLCTADETGTAVSLIQSNASGFGAHLVEPRTGTFLHDRGIGFSLEAGHPAELAPGRRPPHTLAPLAGQCEVALRR
ncbi:MAG: gamma-glutamyltransferase, partial [Actinomycetota bacterium]